MTDEKLSEEIFGEGINDGNTDPMVGGEFIDDSEVVEVKLTKEEILKIDMEKLTGYDTDMQSIGLTVDGIQIQIDEWSEKKGFLKNLIDLKGKKSEFNTLFNVLKKDIGKRGLEIHEKTKNIDPAPGVKIQKSKDDDVELIVDDVEAIAWLIKKELLTFLTYDQQKYIDQLELGSFPDMPGELKKTPVYKPSISLKPYQSED